MNQNRLTYVDTAKFLAILFVIVSHCYQPTKLGDFLFSFHVQMFFILFGYVHKVKSSQTLKEYCMGSGKKLFKRIMIPYILMFFILGNPLNLISFLIMLYASGLAFGGLGFSAPHLWYLPCYFISVLLYDVINISLKDKKILNGILICSLALISAVLNSESHIHFNIGGGTYYLTGFPELSSYPESSPTIRYIGFPFAFNVALTCIFFIFIGNLIREFFDSKDIVINIKKSMAIMLLCLVVGILCYYENRGEFLRAVGLANYGNYIYFILTSVSFSVFFLLLSKYIDCSLFSKYGKQTMTIYIFHPLCMKIIYKFIPDLYGLRVILVLVLTCLLIPLIKRVDPYLVGESK